MIGVWNGVHWLDALIVVGLALLSWALLAWSEFRYIKKQEEKELIRNFADTPYDREQDEWE